MTTMRNLLETVKHFSEAPATDDSAIINVLSTIDMELDTLTGRLYQVVKRSHNNQPLVPGTPAASERNQAKEPILHHLQTISELLDRL